PRSSIQRACCASRRPFRRSRVMPPKGWRKRRNVTQQVDQIRRAQEVIDRDPEEARDRLQAHTSQQVTMTDVMALFREMQASTERMVSTLMGGMQAQIEDLKAANRKPGEKSAWTEEDLARLNDQEQYLR